MNMWVQSDDDDNMYCDDDDGDDHETVRYVLGFESRWLLRSMSG